MLSVSCQPAEGLQVRRRQSPGADQLIPARSCRHNGFRVPGRFCRVGPRQVARAGRASQWASQPGRGLPACGVLRRGGGGALGSLRRGCVARLFEFGSFLALVDPADNRGKQAEHEVEQHLNIRCQDRLPRQTGVQPFCEAVGQGGLFLRTAGVGRLVGAGNLAAHVCVGREVFHPVIIHDAEIAASEGIRHG